ncbi:hypothetical protein L1987_72971 [Smallanthus sonchifolius]|uniref:Uncharacterized protein n=1 Tax=Smallanthus sonchifolius TaxID=185202 RepID=A0ACB9AWY5_9ASTR|nr:hypothetical protein L1987_72971 [Smallanthus sonchifolius]
MPADGAADRRNDAPSLSIPTTSLPTGNGNRLKSLLSDETIWKCLRAAGFDEESIKRRDKGSLIVKLEAKGQSKSFNASTQTSGDLIVVGAHVGGGTIKVWNPKICLRLYLERQVIVIMSRSTENIGRESCPAISIFQRDRNKEECHEKNSIIVVSLFLMLSLR